MRFAYSFHWSKKRERERSDIVEFMFEYAIQNAQAQKDRYHENAQNVICPIPPSGRKLKVVYRRIGKDKVKIITAYWLE